MKDTKQWRGLVEKQAADMPRAADRYGVRVVPDATIDWLQSARQETKEMLSAARKPVADLEAADRTLEKLSDDIRVTVESGAVGDSRWDLSIGERGKRAVWSNDGVRNMLTGLIGDVAAYATTHPACTAGELVDHLTKVMAYDNARQRAEDEGWIGGVVPTLVVHAREKPIEREPPRRIRRTMMGG